MRHHFGKILNSSLKKDNNIWVLTGDLGFGVLDSVRKNYSDRVYNMGASEQLMLGAAVGLSYNGKIPLCYSISPFVIFRPYEWIRNYLNHEKTPVKLIGAGRNKDYGHLGFSHWADDDEAALSVFPNIKIYKPENESELENIWEEFLYNNLPCYLNLKR